MGLTAEQSAKLEEIKQRDRILGEYFAGEGEWAAPTEEEIEIVEDIWRAEWNAKTPQEKETIFIQDEFSTMAETLDDIQRYYWEFEGKALVPENELAKRVNLSLPTIKTYCNKGILQVFTTEKAKRNGERRYYDLLESINAIEEQKAHKRQRLATQIEEVRHTDRNGKGQYTKSDNN